MPPQIKPLIIPANTALRILSTMSVTVLSGVDTMFTMNSRLNRMDVMRKDFDFRNRFMLLLLKHDTQLSEFSLIFR
ncbi:hypothetical protein D3C75_1117510 [compost metagenome]